MPTLKEDHTSEEKQPQPESWEEKYEEYFYEGERNSVNCRKHKIYATPSELKSFIRSETQKAYQEGYDKGREELEKELCQSGNHKFVPCDEFEPTCIRCGKFQS